MLAAVRLHRIIHHWRWAPDTDPTHRGSAMNPAIVSSRALSMEIQMLRQRVAQLEDVGLELLHAVETGVGFMAGFESCQSDSRVDLDLQAMRRAVSAGLKVI